MGTKRRRKKNVKQNPVYAAVMLILALVLFFITKLDMPESNSGADEPVLDAAAGEMQVHYIDVGQGDSELIRLPKDEGGYINILIDSGENGYGDTVIDYVEALGVNYLDAVIVTHPHSDHMGCMDDVLKHFEVGKFYMCDIPESITPTTRSYEDMLDVLIDKGLKISTVGTGDTLSELTEGVSGAAFKVLGPDIGHNMDDLNNCSLIIKLYFGENTFLFTGDAEMVAYENVKGTIGAVDVLKVGHHGSYNATDEELIEETSPSIAVISCGKDNDYGHPHDSTMKILENAGLEIHRTDLEGSIVVSSDGTELKVA